MCHLGIFYKTNVSFKSLNLKFRIQYQDYPTLQQLKGIRKKVSRVVLKEKKEMVLKRLNKFSQDSVIIQRILRILGILSIISTIILMALSSYDLQELMLIDQLEANIRLAEILRIEDNIGLIEEENDENIWRINKKVFCEK